MKRGKSCSMVNLIGVDKSPRMYPAPSRAEEKKTCPEPSINIWIYKKLLHSVLGSNSLSYCTATDKLFFFPASL